MYVTSVTILKHYILLGDMHHSVQLLYWREADHALLPISKDYDPTVPLCTEFLYDGAKLGMMMTDDEGNLQLFQENPRYLSYSLCTYMFLFNILHYLF